jgi:hypothetical protein
MRRGSPCYQLSTKGIALYVRKRQNCSIWHNTPTLGLVPRVRSLGISNAVADSEPHLLTHSASGHDGLPEGVGAEAADKNHLLSGKQQCQNSLTCKCSSNSLLDSIPRLIYRSLFPACLGFSLAYLMLCSLPAGNRTHGYCRTFAAS